MVHYFKINNFNLLNMKQLNQEIIKFKKGTYFLKITKNNFSFISDKSNKKDLPINNKNIEIKKLKDE